MLPGQADQLIGPRVAGVAGDDRQLGEEQRDVVEMGGAPDLVAGEDGSVAGQDEHGQSELDAGRVQRVVGPVPRREVVEERKDLQRNRPGRSLAPQSPDGVDPGTGVDTGARKEPIGGRGAERARDLPRTARFRYAFKPEIKKVEGTRDYFVGELKALGPMSAHEKWGFALFAIASLLAFTRPLYSDLVPAFRPAYAFLTCAIVCFLIRPKGEHLMTWEYAQGKMMWGLFYLFAGGTALGRILSETGTANYIADSLLPYASGGGFVAVMVFAGLTLLMTQITNNTAAVAITVPITISTFQSLDLNPLPFVYIVTTVGNCGFMLPTSAGGPAVAAGYGINLKTMAVKGFWACLIALVTCVIVGYLLALYWPAFSTA